MALSIFSLMGSIFVDSSEAENSIAKTEEKSNKLSESFINGIATAGKWAAGIATAAAGAAVAIALDEAVKSGRAKKGDIVLLVTFGAGLTWSSAAIRL